MTDELVLKEWIGLIFGLVSFCLTGVLSGVYIYFRNQLKEYKKLLDQKRTEEINEAIDERLKEVVKDIEELRTSVMTVTAIEKSHMDLIISSYRYRLVQLCKLYLKQNYMTQEQYDQLTEFYKVYSGLGGNGQAHEYYQKAIKLDIKSAQ